MRSESSTAARILAPLAFLLAVTVLVLLVRSALDSEPAAVTGTGPVETLPAETEPAPEQPEPDEPPAETEPPAQTEPPANATYYTIEAGDTLESIASRNDTTVEQLLELNPGIDPVALTVGQRIRIA
jgi:LysM repeat protein